MARILLVAGNVFRGVLHRRILYVWFFAVGLLILRSIAPLLFNFGNPALQEYMYKRSVSGGLDSWSSLCIALSVFMGATAIGSEISGKTIVPLFARPIARWEFLLGKWIGVQGFSLLAFACGLVVGFAFASYLDAGFEGRILSFAVTQTVVSIALYSGLSLALNTVFTSGVAGALAVIVVFLPGIVEPLMDSDTSIYHASGFVLDFVVPPGYTSHYNASVPALLPLQAFDGGGFGGGFGGRGFGRGGRRGVPPFVPQAEAADPEIENGEEATILLQNLGYAAAFFALGYLAFVKRDLRLS